MNENDAAHLVDEEIKTRYRNLNETQFGDWVSVVMKAPDYALAKAIVRELATQPGETLTVKSFLEKLGLSGGHKHHGKPLPAAYDPFVLCLEAPAGHPEWQGRQWFTLGFEGQEGFRRNDHANQDYVTQFAQEAARLVQQREGGQWCGVIEPVCNDWPKARDPDARRKAQEHIRNGPDSPGRRFLLQHSRNLAEILKPVPAKPPPVKTATRQVLEALSRPDQAPVAVPQKLDWQSEDLEPCATQPQPREPGEEG